MCSFVFNLDQFNVREGINLGGTAVWGKRVCYLKKGGKGVLKKEKECIDRSI